MIYNSSPVSLTFFDNDICFLFIQNGHHGPDYGYIFHMTSVLQHKYICDMCDDVKFASHSRRLIEIVDDDEMKV